MLLSYSCFNSIVSHRSSVIGLKDLMSLWSQSSKWQLHMLVWGYIIISIPARVFEMKGLFLSRCLWVAILTSLVTCIHGCVYALGRIKCDQIKTCSVQILTTRPLVSSESVLFFSQKLLPFLTIFRNLLRLSTSTTVVYY